MEAENQNEWRELLNRVESPVFNEEFWVPLEQHLDKEKKNRVKAGMFLFLLAISLWLGITHLYPVRTEKKELVLGSESIQAKAEEKNSTMELVKNENEEKMMYASKEKSLFVHKGKVVSHINNLNKVSEQTTSFENIEIKEQDETSDNGNMSLKMLGKLPYVYTKAADRILFMGLQNKGSKSSQKKSRKTSFDFALGIHNMSKKLQAVSSDATSLYVFNRRSEEEFDKVCFSPRVNMNYRLSKKLELSVGLEFATYGERIAYKPYALKNKEIKIYSYQAERIPVYDFVTRTTTWQADTNVYIAYATIKEQQKDADIGKHRRKTTVSYLEIPLLLGYRMDFKGYALATKTGLALGVFTGTTVKGQYLNADGNALMNLSSDKRRWASCIFNYCLQIRISKVINRQVSVFVEPSFKTNLNAIYQNTASRQKYTGLGAYFGLCYGL